MSMHNETEIASHRLELWTEICPQLVITDNRHQRIKQANRLVQLLASFLGFTRSPWPVIQIVVLATCCRNWGMKEMASSRLRKA